MVEELVSKCCNVQCLPGDENQLVGSRARLRVDLDIKDSIAAVTIWEPTAESLEILGLLALLLNLNEFLVIGDLEDKVLQGQRGTRHQECELQGATFTPPQSRSERGTDEQSHASSA